jgi:hypothetical protein
MIFLKLFTILLVIQSEIILEIKGQHLYVSKTVCSIPNFIKTNSDYYDHSNGKINIKNINKLWKNVKFQMYLKHEKELHGMVKNKPANINFFNIMFYELKSFITCLTKNNLI